MTRTIRAMAVAVGLAAAAGYADVAGAAPAWAEERVAAPAASQGSLTFSSTQSTESGQPLAATGGTGSIGFQGHVQTGTPCYDVSGSHRVRGNRVVLTVTLRSTGGFCTQVITYHDYVGQVTGLSAGTYDVQIVHVVDGRSATAYSGRVTVS